MQLQKHFNRTVHVYLLGKTSLFFDTEICVSVFSWIFAIVSPFLPIIAPVIPLGTSIFKFVSVVKPLNYLFLLKIISNKKGCWLWVSITGTKSHFQTFLDNSPIRFEVRCPFICKAMKYKKSWLLYRNF